MKYNNTPHIIILIITIDLAIDSRAGGTAPAPAGRPTESKGCRGRFPATGRPLARPHRSGPHARTRHQTPKPLPTALATNIRHPPGLGADFRRTPGTILQPPGCPHTGPPPTGPITGTAPAVPLAQALRCPYRRKTFVRQDGPDQKKILNNCPPAFVSMWEITLTL